MLQVIVLLLGSDVIVDEVTNQRNFSLPFDDSLGVFTMYSIGQGSDECPRVHILCELHDRGWVQGRGKGGFSTWRPWL